MPDAERARGAPRRRAARALPDLQRGLREQRRARRCSAPTCRSEAIRLTRARARACCPTTREVAGLLALMLLTDARRAGAHRAGRRADPARRAGPHAVGPRGDRRRRRADHARRCRGARSARTSCRPRSRPCTTKRRAPRTPTGRRSSRSTACSSACRTTRWSRSTARSPRRWCTARRPAWRCSTPLDADARLAGHHRLDAVRAHLLEMAGDAEAAIALYRQAADRVTNSPEARVLIAQAARLAEAAVHLFETDRPKMGDIRPGRKESPP